MAKNYYQDGNKMDWHNNTDKDVIGYVALCQKLNYPLCANKAFPIGIMGVIHDFVITYNIIYNHQVYPFNYLRSKKRPHWKMRLNNSEYINFRNTLVRVF